MSSFTTAGCGVGVGIWLVNGWYIFGISLVYLVAKRGPAGEGD